jgi:ribonuclease HII
MWTAGIDEVGRGPLAGPVLAAAVILDPARIPAGLADSKALAASRREALDILIRRDALAFAIGRAEVEEIDTHSILGATMLAMQRAVAGLPRLPDLALVDGDRAPRLPCATQTLIRGDRSEPAISAASIIAKVARDREMRELDVRWPGYGWVRNKGYPTAEHLTALALLGVTPHHRRSFAPVRRVLDGALPSALESGAA